MLAIRSTAGVLALLMLGAAAAAQRDARLDVLKKEVVRDVEARSGFTQQMVDSIFSFSELATALQTTMDAPVVNRTGLSGGYEFKIELPPDATAVRRSLSIGISTTVNGTPLTEPSGVSASDAVKQIGLQLERRRTPVDVLVIDKLERTPTEN